MSPVLARELAAARPRFNAEVAAARRARSGFDTAALSEAIVVRVDPIVTAVDRVAPDRVAGVVAAGFTLTVALIERALSSERRALVDRVWSEAAPAFAALIAEQPDRVLAMLTNAALTLLATPGARSEEWVARMTALAPLVTPDTLAAAGQVVAWRSGMAHYRDRALAAADTLPEPLALAAVGAAGTWTEVRSALAADRWWTPEPTADNGVRFGGFTGFGGPFATPPELRASRNGIFVRSGDRIGLLIADAWGATLHPASPDEFAGGAPAVSAGRGPASLPATGLHSATTRDSVAYASPLSHFVVVGPCRT